METKIFNFLANYAHEPFKLYSFILLFMLVAGMGVPIPEEIILIASGLIAYMAMHPELYPPQEVYNPVQLKTIMLWMPFCVVFADSVVYLLGRLYGKKILRAPFIKRFLPDEHMEKINNWFHKYSYFACGIFRFTPGIRFLGHIVCGMLRIPYLKFLLVNACIAYTSVPIQLHFIAKYGDVILGTIKKFKIVLLIIIFLFFLYTIIKNNMRKKSV